MSAGAPMNSGLRIHRLFLVLGGGLLASTMLLLPLGCRSAGSEGPEAEPTQVGKPAPVAAVVEEPAEEALEGEFRTLARIDTGVETSYSMPESAMTGYPLGVIVLGNLVNEDREFLRGLHGAAIRDQKTPISVIQSSTPESALQIYQQRGIYSYLLYQTLSADAGEVERGRSFLTNTRVIELPVVHGNPATDVIKGIPTLHTTPAFAEAMASAVARQLSKVSAPKVAWQLTSQVQGEERAAQVAAFQKRITAAIPSVQFTELTDTEGGEAAASDFDAVCLLDPDSSRVHYFNARKNHPKAIVALCGDDWNFLDYYNRGLVDVLVRTDFDLLLKQLKDRFADGSALAADATRAPALILVRPSR